MSAEKPFEPTPSRLTRARREGDVPASPALGAAGALSGGALTLFAVIGLLGGASRAAFVAAAEAHPAAAGTGDAAGTYLTLAACAIAVPCGAAAGALLAHYVPAGRLALRFPGLKCGRLNPVDGFRRMLSRDAAVAGLKAIVVASAVAAVALTPMFDAFGGGRTAAAPSEIAAVALRAIGEILVASLSVAAALSIADVMLERAKWRRRLRMSLDELRREHKQNEGDPLLRGRRRNAHRALARGSIGRLKEAAFVVCNPSQVAIALAYRPPEIVVPQVLIRAIDEAAREVKRRARELDIPIVENVALARTLLTTTDAGDYIPAVVYGAVAAIVAQVAREPVRV